MLCNDNGFLSQLEGFHQETWAEVEENVRVEVTSRMDTRRVFDSDTYKISRKVESSDNAVTSIGMMLKPVAPITGQGCE